METRFADWRSLIPVAVFAAACLTGMILLWSAFGGSTPLRSRGYRVSVSLGTALGVFPGTDVRVAGLTIGQVVEVERRGAHAVARLDIQPAYAPLRRGTRAIVRTKSLLGEAYIALAPGSASQPIISDGGALEPTDVLRSQRLDDVIGTFDPATRRNLQALAAGLARATSGAGASTNSALGDLGPAVAGLDETLGVLHRQGANLQRFIANGATVVSSLGRRQAAVRATIRSADDVLAVTRRQDRALGSTLRRLPGFLVALRAASRTLGSADSDLRPAALGLSRIAPEVLPALRETRATTPLATQVFDGLQVTLRVADRGLPALRKILRSASPALAAVHPALRELQPVLELLALARDSLVNTFAGVAQVHNGTFVTVDNRVQHYVNGIINVWNESIGGWAKRLPTNRGNTYPKPGFLNNIATGLESFDCRNTGNPSYLPAFGGTPPCKTQGAWTYNGQTRFYPTLQPAPP